MFRSTCPRASILCARQGFRINACQTRLKPSYHGSINGFHSRYNPRGPREVSRRVDLFVLGSLFVFGVGIYAVRRFDGLAAFGLSPLMLHGSPSEPEKDRQSLHSARRNSQESNLSISSDTSNNDKAASNPVTKYGTPEEVQIAIEELRKAFPGEYNVVTDRNTLTTYGSSENSYLPSSPHSVVVRVGSTEDVVKVVDISRRYRVPIIPYSGATSLEGHFSGYPTGSICLDMSGMNQILDINEKDSDLRCQSGVRWEDVNRILKEKGIPLFFPLDPGPGATIGGMIGTGCSGTNAVRYGTAKAEWFLNITVVLPSGKVIKTRQRARKSSAGFDTTKLFIGAEGTLGIVTEATLRLAPLIPTKVAMAQFPDVERAVSAVQEILNTPYGPHIQCVELLDDHMMAAINNAGLVNNPYPVQDTLFFKLQGAPDCIEHTSKAVQNIVSKHGSSNFQFAATDEEAEELWENRKYALISTMAAHPGTRCWTTDVCVPVSQLPRLVYETKQDLAKAGLKSTIVGHVGDGNFHALLLFHDEEELKSASGAVHRLIHRAIAMDGTCTGEHGVGVGKSQYLVEELGEDTVELMKTVKRAIDPLDLLNPGKLYPGHDNEKQHPSADHCTC